MEKYYADGYRLQMGLTDVDLLFTRRGDEQVVVTLSVALAKTLTCKLAAQPHLTTSSHSEERAEQVFAEHAPPLPLPDGSFDPHRGRGLWGSEHGSVMRPGGDEAFDEDGRGASVFDKKRICFYNSS